MGKKTRFIDYAHAIRWGGNDYIKLDCLMNLDPSIWDNMRNYNDKEIAEIYLTDCTVYEVERLEKSFSGLIFSFSNLLNKFVLMVDHCGTAWDSVPVEILNSGLAVTEAERKFMEHLREVGC